MPTSKSLIYWTPYGCPKVKRPKDHMVNMVKNP